VSTPLSQSTRIKNKTSQWERSPLITPRRDSKGKYVDLEFEGPIRGRYGRLLAYVFVDEVNFNLELVRQGLSPYYIKYGLSQKYDQEFREAERYARKHELNIWGDPGLTQKYLKLKSKWGQYRSKVSSPPGTVQTNTVEICGQ